MTNKGGKPAQLRVAIVLFASAASIAMLYLPITYQGYRFDLRVIPLVFLAFICGGREALVALLLASAWRLGMGGEGTVPGIVFGMVLPTLFSLLFYRGENMRFTTLQKLFLFSSVWAISDVPVIFIVPNGWEAFLSIFPARYTSFLFAAYLVYILAASTLRRRKTQERLLFFAERDPLTQLYNVRKFFECAEQAAKQTVPGYFALLDVDHFKNINDTYGHLTGDVVLKQIAALVYERCKAAHRDEAPVFVGRYGGEEFILYVSACADEEVACFLEKVRDDIERAAFLAADGAALPQITVSIGAARWFSCLDMKQVVSAADECLYQVKEQGRNGICIYK
ncbi:diguanylate cyclase [Aneurinibacillus sp. BA2021]|nr:diguanylate cyclase [Aneurinibacillus sp. BA2021]